MDDSQHWTVEHIDRAEFARGGLVSPGRAVLAAVFDSGYIIPARLASLIENPFAEEQDEG